MIDNRFFFDIIECISSADCAEVNKRRKESWFYMSEQKIMNHPVFQALLQDVNQNGVHQTQPHQLYREIQQQPPSAVRARELHLNTSKSIWGRRFSVFLLPVDLVIIACKTIQLLFNKNELKRSKNKKELLERKVEVLAFKKQMAYEKAAARLQCWVNREKGGKKFSVASFYSQVDYDPYIKNPHISPTPSTGFNANEQQLCEPDSYSSNDNHQPETEREKNRGDEVVAGEFRKDVVDSNEQEKEKIQTNFDQNNIESLETKKKESKEKQKEEEVKQDDLNSLTSENVESFFSTEEDAIEASREKYKNLSGEQRKIISRPDKLPIEVLDKLFDGYDEELTKKLIKDIDFSLFSTKELHNIFFPDGLYNYKKGAKRYKFLSCEQKKSITSPNKLPINSLSSFFKEFTEEEQKELINDINFIHFKKEDFICFFSKTNNNLETTAKRYQLLSFEKRKEVRDLGIISINLILSFSDYYTKQEKKEIIRELDFSLSTDEDLKSFFPTVTIEEQKKTASIYLSLDEKQRKLFIKRNILSYRQLNILFEQYKKEEIKKLLKEVDFTTFTKEDFNQFFPPYESSKTRNAKIYACLSCEQRKYISHPDKIGAVILFKIFKSYDEDTKKITETIKDIDFRLFPLHLTFLFSTNYIDICVGKNMYKCLTHEQRTYVSEKLPIDHLNLLSWGDTVRL